MRQLARTCHGLPLEAHLRTILVQPGVQPRRAKPMASLVKPWITRYVDDKGQRVSKNTPGAKKVRERSRLWYAQYKPRGSKKWKRKALFADKRASQTELGKIITALELDEAGLVNPHKDQLSLDI